MRNIQAIHLALTAAFEPRTLEIVDQSHLHAGHYAGNGNNASHLDITLQSRRFLGVSKVKQHQMVMKELKPFLDAGLHAVSLHLSE
ncbi:BolA family transcriptional regulator [bacterium]|nr:BolA family transcriptional regulator [bacterium]